MTTEIANRASHTVRFMVRPELTPEMAHAAAAACHVAAERKQRILPSLVRGRDPGAFREMAHEIGLLRVTARTIEAALAGDPQR